MIVRHNSEFCGAEEIVAKGNKDGTYHVTLKSVAKEEGTDKEFDVVVEVPRSCVSIEALVTNNGAGTMYKVTQVDRPADVELPENSPSPAERCSPRGLCPNIQLYR